MARLSVPYETRAITGEGKGEWVGRVDEVIRAVPPSARGLPGAAPVPRAHAGRQREPRQPSQMEFQCPSSPPLLPSLPLAALPPKRQQYQRRARPRGRDAAGGGRGGRRPGRGALVEACALLAAGALVGAVGFVRSICGAVND